MAEHRYYLVIYLEGLCSLKISPIMSDVSKDFRLQCIRNVASMALSVHLAGETEESQDKPQNV